MSELSVAFPSAIGENMNLAISCRTCVIKLLAWGTAPYVRFKEFAPADPEGGEC